jgi:hypothetical protein
MTRKSWQKWTLFVLNSDTVYCSTIFANRIESRPTKFIKCLYKVNETCKHLHGHWSQIPAKRTNIKPTAWLQTPTKCRLRQTPPQAPPWHHLHLLLPESPPSQLNFVFFRIAWMAHSSSQAWRTLVVIKLGVDNYCYYSRWRHHDVLLLFPRAK